MTQEDKGLLLKDLSARLGYGVKVCIKLPNHQEKTFEEQVGDLKELTIYGGYLVNSKGIDYRSFNLDIKPYLRPMSSMTEEEKRYIHNKFGATNHGSIETYSFESFEGGHSEVYIVDMAGFIDWLNRNMFDYRGLIPKGLAIEALKEMYEEKTS